MANDSRGGYQGPSYDSEDWMIAWTGSDLKVGLWPEEHGWSEAYDNTTGYCFYDLHGQDDEDIAQRLVGQALFLVSTGVPIEIVLKEFSKIRVWREMKIKLTTPGDFWAFYPKIGYQVINPYSD